MAQWGLDDEEVQQSRLQFGSNRLSEIKGEGFWHKFFGNFKDPIIKILCVALLVNLALTIYGQVRSGSAEWFEPVGIAVAVLLATLVSTFSEYRNETAFRKLQEEADKIRCKVYRNGTLVELPIDELVVGDCIWLQAGDKVPADGVLASGAIAVDQAVLNGESREAHKFACRQAYDWQQADLLDNHSLFRGAVVAQGSGIMRVSVVGDASLYGALAAELQENADRPTPLKVKLAHLAKNISRFGYIGGILIAAVFLFVKFFVQWGFDGSQIAAYFSQWDVVLSDVVESVMLAVVIIVMAVPEGLPLMIALVSGLNMRKMLKDNVLVRKIMSIETAGSLNILFCDKTGTITTGKLQVVDYVDGAGTSYGVDAIPANLQQKLLESITCNTESMITGEGADKQVVGSNSTDRALLRYAAALGGVPRTPDNRLQFDSTIKYSAGQFGDTVYVKGAAERVLGMCNRYLDNDGNWHPLRPEVLVEVMNTMSAAAKRLIGFAVGEGRIEDGVLSVSGSLGWVGMVGIRDEVRPDAADAIRQVQKAGVQVVMITGDRKETAVTIATEAGIMQEGGIVITSDELAAMDDDALKAVLPHICVVARALPQDKSRLVTLAKELDLVTGMTGDGVNDSPALKKADVGFAVGSGTEVAKEAADIVIMDDNFVTIAKSILYGRTIYNNICKFIVYQLSINIAAVIVNFLAPLLGMQTPLTIMQILWLNLVIDTLAALAFGGEPALPEYMREAPKQRTAPIVSRGMMGACAAGGGTMIVVSMLLLLVPALSSFFGAHGGHTATEVFQTAYFTYFIFAAFFNAFCVRTDRFNWFAALVKNKGFILCMGGIAVIQLLLTYFGGKVFAGYGLTAAQLGAVLGLAALVLPVDWIRKGIAAALTKRKA